MAIVVGIDEAGYGPLLGPLVVSATLWQARGQAEEQDFWASLKDCVCRATRRGDWRLPVDDSKRVFDRKKGIASLERPVLAFAKAAGLSCETLADFLRSVGADPSASAHGIPWYRNLDLPLPLGGRESACEGVSSRLRRCMTEGDVRCCGMMSQVVTEDAFNRRVERTRNKATVLLEQVLRLIYRAVAACPGSDLRVVVDRLGGRSDYRTLLRDAFADHHLREEEVSERRSASVLTSAQGDLWVEFVVDGDQKHLPVALASMLSKYVREALMLSFNRYWRSVVPDLRPTAGYYTDAKRFLAELGARAADAGVPVERFVRSR